MSSNLSCPSEQCCNCTQQGHSSGLCCVHDEPGAPPIRSRSAAALTESAARDHVQPLVVTLRRVWEDGYQFGLRDEVGRACDKGDDDAIDLAIERTWWRTHPNATTLFTTLVKDGWTEQQIGYLLGVVRRDEGKRARKEEP